MCRHYTSSGCCTACCITIMKELRNAEIHSSLAVEKQQRYALVGEVCPHCDSKIFPPRDVCPHCGGEAKKAFAFSGRGQMTLSPPWVMDRRALKKMPPTPWRWSSWKRDPCHRPAHRPGRAAGADRHAGRDGDARIRQDGDERGCWCTGINSGPYFPVPSNYS